MINPFHIVQGIINEARTKLGIADSETELLAQIRLHTCIGCDDLEINEDDTKCLKSGACCKRCGCNLAWKSRSDGKCEKWEK